MAKTNYNKMSTKNKEDVTKDVAETNSPEVEQVANIEDVKEPESVTETNNNDIEPTVANTDMEESESWETAGVVVGCIALNVRKEADIKSDIMHVFKVGEEVMIDLENSTDDWYSVYVDFGNRGDFGYCMKKYISVK